jgi:YidC/Oxa1 family membrane protein insertase
MDQRQRLILIVILSFAFITLLQMFFADKNKPAENAQVAEVADGGSAKASAPQQVAAAPSPAPSPELGMTVDAGVDRDVWGNPVPPVPERTTVRDRADMKLKISSEGASIASAELTGKRERAQQQVSILEGWQKLFGKQLPPPPQMNLAVPAPGAPPPMSISIEGPAPFSPQQRFAFEDEYANNVSLRARSGPWEIVRRYQWEPKGFALRMEVDVKNISNAPQTGELGVHSTRRIDPKDEQKSSLFGGIGNEASVQCLLGDDLKKRLPKEDEQREEAKGSLRFVGIDQQYFLTAIYPMEPLEGRCVLIAGPTLRQASAYFPLSLKAGESQTMSFGVFMGPKDLELLKAQSTTAGLERTVDFGWWAVICRVLLVVLKFFHGLVANWGVAIILLTLTVKVILLPLTHKAMVSAESMKKLQPKMEEIKKKFPDDRERQNVEVMKLYQEAKVNPLGGCLPLLLQLPIWAALFTTLRTSYDLYGEPFVGPVWTDLTYKDPTYLLPLALGITMIITQRLQPQMMDKQQAFIFTWIMPVFFTGLMMNYPAGLALYIFTNNLLSILQQFLLRRYLEKKGIAAPRAKGPPPDTGGRKMKVKESES